jgi:hypothetical protein
MTGDNSDTTLTLSRAPLTENAVHVYWDGVYQHKDTWAVSGTTLTFSTAPPTGVKVEAVIGSQTNILYGNDVSIDKMTGDASDTTLSLSVTPSNENHVNVYFDGVYQSKDNYTLSGTTITFSTAPPTGVLVEAVSNQAVSVGTATGIAASALTGLSEVTAADADHVLIYDASGSALKKSLVSDFAKNTTEEIQDIVGGMVSSNTETGIAVSYEDGDGTLDFVLAAAQPTVTSLGTLTGLTGGTGDLVWDTTTLVVDSSANKVGIGTASPARNLTVSSSGQTDLSIVAGTGASAQLQFGDSGDDNIGQIEYNNSDNDMAFYTNATEYMTLKSDGKLGIGTTSPNGRLEVREGASDFDPESHIIISNDDIADGDLMGILFKQRNENDGKAWFGTERMGDYGVSDFVFLTDSVGDDNAVAATDEKMRITYTGNVVPGTTSTQDLGSNSLRWANLYTGDLHLSNEGSEGNEVDGTSGDWTIQEGDEHLYIKNNKSGKKYRFALEEIE